MADIQRSAGPSALLDQLLEHPAGVAALQGLEAPALARLLREVGLEDAGALIGLASSRQLEALLDEDLWHPEAPGGADRFDAARFGVWLEVLLELGPDAAAARLAQVDEELLELGLSHHLLVLDLDALAQRRMGTARRGGLDAAARVDKALESQLTHELDGYLLISRSGEHWDALLMLLLSLDTEHHDVVVRVLERLCLASQESVGDDEGLYAVLTAAEQLEEDAAGARLQRRERDGFVASEDAAGLLALARAGRLGADAATALYTRALQPGAAAPPPSAAPASPLLASLMAGDSSRPPPVLRSLAGGEGGESPAAPGRLSEALAWLRSHAPQRAGAQLHTLAFLANALTAGCSREGRAMRPVEAAQAAVAACNLGLELEVARTGAGAGEVLARSGLLHLFGVGWQALHRDVVAEAARVLDAALAQAGDGGAPRVLSPARAALARDVHTGRPWAFRPRLSALARHLPRGALPLLRELLDECPSLDGRFLGTPLQLREARLRLASLLGMAPPT